MAMRWLSVVLVVVTGGACTGGRDEKPNPAPVTVDGRDAGAPGVASPDGATVAPPGDAAPADTAAAPASAPVPVGLASHSLACATGYAAINPEVAAAACRIVPGTEASSRPKVALLAPEVRDSSLRLLGTGH